ncbi:HlyD family secretion protein [Rhizobium sp. BK251]|uniref:HlyD family secretion protein n=1 Tax=Rhizobium sp. BK251 TaxID=2512125 RepID=UPI0010CF169A|nr:HlyD family secretion protein [Rhizobium sp. BK251]TCL70386.1 multidrug efflux system membrane fusion protein [Rhizobium sp. BK251]
MGDTKGEDKTDKAPSGEAAGPERRRLTRLVVGIGALIGVLVAWQVLTAFVAYTDDAYVRSDLVAIAPQVSGMLASVEVADNQKVRRGELLAVIDKVPFELAVEAKKAALDEATAERDGGQDDLVIARDQLGTTAATLKYATEEQQRLAMLSGQAISQAQLDRANDALQSATASQAAARATIDRASRSLARLEAVAARAKADLDLAQWQLEQTEIRAPVDGSINNLNLTVGDMASAGQPLIGMVDDADWRIIANYKEGYIHDMKVGQTAWVWLDARPWRVYRAEVRGVARGISREPGPQDILPYVEPTTDWIRLSRRFPVTITLVDPPADLTLYMGADARTVIFP